MLYPCFLPVKQLESILIYHFPHVSGCQVVKTSLPLNRVHTKFLDNLYVKKFFIILAKKLAVLLDPLDEL